MDCETKKIIQGVSNISASSVTKFPLLFFSGLPESLLSSLVTFFFLTTFIIVLVFMLLCVAVFFILRTYVTHFFYQFSPSSLIFSCLCKLSSYFCICSKKFLLNPKLLYTFKVFFALYITLHHYCLCLPFPASNFVLTFTYKSAVDPLFLKFCVNLDVPVSNTAIFTFSTSPNLCAQVSSVCSTWSVSW